MRTHNNSLDITLRTLTCTLPTVFCHWFDLSLDPNLAGIYSTLKCVDWSLWSSANPGSQLMTIRAYQDQTPLTRSGVCPGQGFGSTSEPGPDVATQLLLWEETTIFPPSTQGVNNLVTGRSDGDRSIVFEGPTGGGVLLEPDIAIFVEVEHLGEAQNRFGSNGLGEVGDLASGPEVTWIKAPNCGGGGCTTTAGTTVGDWAKWSEFTGANRDIVMQVHLDAGDTTNPGPLPFCPEDITGPGPDPINPKDKEVNVVDLLLLLGTWGTLAPPRPAGDVAPCAPPPGTCIGDNLVNVVDLLALLGAWGPCPNPNKLCADLIASDPLALNPARISEDGSTEFEIDPLYMDGPQRGPTDSLAEVLRGPTTLFWRNYGPGNADGFQFGDYFGIFMLGPQIDWIIGGDAWFLYEAPCNGKAFFEAASGCGAGEVTDTQLEIYPGDACPTDWADIIGWDDDSGGGCSGFMALASANVVAGESYLVRIGGWGGESGTATLTYTCVDNSACVAALPIDIGGTETGNTAGASVEGPVACGGLSQSEGGRWYSVVGDGNTLTASTAGTCAFESTIPAEASIFDSMISVYCGTVDTICEDLTCVDSAQGSNVCNLHEEVSWCSTEGTVYYILVHGNPGVPGPPFFSEGFFQLDVTTDGTDCAGAIQCGQARPSNDLCPNAITIPSGSDGGPNDTDGVVNGVIVLQRALNNVNAAQDGHSSATCGTTSDDVWYLWTAPATAEVVFSTCNTANYDTKLEIYDASIADCPTTSDAGLFTCRNDTAGCAGFTTVTTPFTIFAGQTALIRSGSPNFGTQEGTGTLTITVTITPSSCPGVCPGGASIEGGGLGETLLDDGDVDVTNGGCNMCAPAYDAFTLVDDVTSETFCGQISTYQTDADLDCVGGPDGLVLDLRDTDWYTIVVPDTPDSFGPTMGSKLTIRLNSEFPASYGVVSDTCGATPGDEVPFIASSINGGLCIDGEFSVSLPTGTYRIVVTSFNTSGVEVGGDGVTHEGHDYVLTVDPFAPAELPPLNDNCADAIAILSNSSTIADNRYATNPPADPGLSCHLAGPGTNAYGSVWYTFIATDTTCTVQTCNSVDGFDSSVAAYTFTNELNPCASLVEVGCDDDGCSGTFLSTFNLTGLTVSDTYYIQLGAWSPGDVGVYTLELSSP